MLLFEDLVMPLLIAIFVASALGLWSGWSLMVTAAFAIGFWVMLVGCQIWLHRPK